MNKDDIVGIGSSNGYPFLITTRAIVRKLHKPKARKLDIQVNVPVYRYDEATESFTRQC